MLHKSYRQFLSLTVLGLFSLSVHAIDPNSATVEELADELVGVGPKLAEKIVKYREQNGDFKSIDELMNVKGIASSVIDKNREQIQIDE